MHRMYMNMCAKLYFVMNYTDKRVDNIDQRMTMDLDLCLRYLFEYLYGGIFKSCVYPGMLRSIPLLILRWLLFHRTMTWAYTRNDKDTHEEIILDYPYGALVGWLPIFVFVTMLAFIVPSICAARKFTNVQERQQEYEADLRQQHQLICNNAHSIGMSDGSGTESSMLSRRFQSVFRNSLLFLRRKIFLDGSELLAMPYGPDILSMIPFALCAMAIYEQQDTSDDENIQRVDPVLQADLARRFFIDSCEVIGFLICSIHLLAQSSAFAKRIMKALELQEEFLMCEAKLDPDGIELLQQTGMGGAGFCGIDLRRSNQRVFGFQDVVRPTPSVGVHLKCADIYTPVGDRLLLHDVNLDLLPGDTCLLVGPSGTGKSSLIRVLARLWPLFKCQDEDRDTVFTRPDSRSVFFIPQKPYMCMGSLRQQIAYPCWESSVLSELTDDTMKSLLHEVDLKSLYNRLQSGTAHPVFKRACTYLQPETRGVTRARTQMMETVQDETGQAIGSRRIAGVGGSTYGSDSGLDYPLHVDDDVGPFDDPSILWDTVLSVGEQQRLQFARLIWHFDWLQRHRHGIHPIHFSTPYSPGLDSSAPAQFYPSPNMSAVTGVTGVSHSVVTPSTARHGHGHVSLGPGALNFPTCNETEPLLSDTSSVAPPPAPPEEGFSFFAILDEATAALDVRAEVCCYSALQKRGIGFLSVSNRPSLLPFHEKVLHLKPSAGGAHHPEVVAACSNTAMNLLKTQRTAPVDGENTIGNCPPRVSPMPELPRVVTPRLPPPRNRKLTGSGSIVPPRVVASSSRTPATPLAFMQPNPSDQQLENEEEHHHVQFELVSSALSSDGNEDCVQVQQPRTMQDQKNETNQDQASVADVAKPKRLPVEKVELDETGAVVFESDLPALPFPRQDFGDAHLNPRFNRGRKAGKLSIGEIDENLELRRNSFG